VHRRLLEDASFMGNVPDIPVAGIDLFLRCRDGNLVGLGICNRVLATPDIPLAPGRDNREVRGEGGISQLEANLVVSLAGTPMRERISSHLTGDFDLPACNERAPHRGAEEVLPTVDSASAEGGPHELFHEFLAQIFE